MFLNRKILKLFKGGVKTSYDNAKDKDKIDDRTMSVKMMEKVGAMLVEAPRTSISSMDIDYHEDLIKELHPMRGAPIQDVFPFLSYLNLET